MRLSEFLGLHHSEKQDIIYREGTYIGKRKQEYWTVLLYQLDSFYIEIFYTSYRKHIDRIHYFYSTRWLDPYLPQIDIELAVL